MKRVLSACVLSLSALLSMPVAYAQVAAGAERAPAPPPALPSMPVEIQSGKVVLAMTGLALDLPADARKAAKWSLAGSYSFTDGGTSFDARDVIDQKVDGALVAGTWVHVGYFNAGDCAAVVKELDVPDRWTEQRDMWGHHWHVAGGTWNFENDLGKKPVIALCTPRPNRASLLLYRFYIQDGVALDKDARLAALPKDPLLARVTAAWTKEASEPVQSLRRPEIKRRGDVEAVRTVHLRQANLDVKLPDDGFAWLARGPGKEGESDFLDRMAPAMPDLSLEVARAPGTRCAEVFPTGADAPKRATEPPPRNIPAGWTSLGTLVLETTQERVVCHEANGAALIVGFLATPSLSLSKADYSPFSPILDVLAKASDAVPANR